MKQGRRLKQGPCPRCLGLRQKQVLSTGTVRSFCSKCWSFYTRSLNLKMKYGLNPIDVSILLSAQHDLCPLCLKNLSKFVVDHDHLTGRVRGLLCVNCNTWLSKYEKPGYVDRAREYLNGKS